MGDDDVEASAPLLSKERNINVISKSDGPFQPDVTVIDGAGEISGEAALDEDPEAQDATVVNDVESQPVPEEGAAGGGSSGTGIDGADKDRATWVKKGGKKQIMSAKEIRK